MNRTFRNRLSAWVIAAIGVGMMLDGATAGSFTRGCASRDLQILFLIEEQECAGSSAELITTTSARSGTGGGPASSGEYGSVTIESPEPSSRKQVCTVLMTDA